LRIGGLDAPVSNASTYDRIGIGYRAIRNTDPVLAGRIWAALGDARTVLNVGAGTGSYEPSDRWVLAVEPSSVMIAQRPHDAAPVIQASVEELPLADRTVDAAMAILTLHHWRSFEAGLRELSRVVRDRVVIVTMDFDTVARQWIIRDYLPELLGHHAARFPRIDRLCELLPNAKSEILPVPRECQDGFMAAFWARPEMYLDPAARVATSPWHDLPAAVVDRALARLRRDLDNGDWHRRYGDLLACDELDVGLRLITAAP
jgi:ubiquinone/menaquinone biosynthesis C-methylase UbiE